MSLQSNINAWQGIYDNTGIYQNGGNPAYIGSVCATDGSFHQGVDIYQSGYKIYDFNWYAGQGVPVGGSSGGKFLVGSDNGFSWDTLPSGSSMKFVTSGELNTLYLGTTPIGDNGASPDCSTLTTFDDDEPLLVIQGFNVAVDYAASLFGSGYDGNSSIAYGTTAFGTAIEDLMSNPGYYNSVTLNSAILYDQAFENNGIGMQTFEWVLDKYLESIGSDITDTVSTIQAALTTAGSDLSIDYFTYADGNYPTSDCGCSATAGVESDLLLAA
ncbi:TPA: hypothetical protein P2A77_001705 [Salmonella enterica subsp. enterica serovar Agona]|nr:hypothetical protein [Salmonella enterica]HDN7360683.1 hypothetical protein [Salmonella enterica subsp. enterica serovar Agona]